MTEEAVDTVSPLRDFRALPLTADLARGPQIVVLTVASGMLAMLVLYAAVASGIGLGPVLDTVVKDWIYNVLLFSAAGMCLARGWKFADQRAGWLVLGTGVALWAIGNVYWTFRIKHLDEFPYPSVADGFWILFYLTAYVSLMLMARTRIERLHASVWLDGLVGMLAVAALGAALVLPKIIADTQETVAAAATNLAYPLGDLLLIALVVGIAALTGWKRARAWLLIGGGFAVLAAADSLYLLRNATDTYIPDTAMDALWPAGMVMLAFAAWQPWRKADHTAFEGWTVIVLPLLFTLASLGLLVYGNLVGINTAALVFATAAAVAATVQTALAFREARALAESRRQAKTDELTGLPNRRALQERLDQMLVHAEKEGSELALVIVDLDRFKDVNDTLGHHAGDLVLKQIGPRLMGALRTGDLLARWGGDEFAVLLPRSGQFAALGIVDRMHAALDRPFPALDMTVHIQASIGVAVFRQDGHDGETLMQRADLAMYHAKAAQSGFEPYTQGHNKVAKSGPHRLGEIRGLDTGELLVHYQPKVDVTAGEVVGVEALVRWDHPERGVLPPGTFLPMAEQTGVIRVLTRHVLDTALRDCGEWRRMGFDLSVAVNLSRSILLDAKLPVHVAHLLERWEVAADRLRLEITEDVAMADPRRTSQVLSGLSALGVGISLDDFGIGHSSLSQLKNLPVDELKIDRSFVLNMESDEKDAAIVYSATELARRLGLAVVAEGVESAETYGRLVDYGCGLVQGNFLSHPLPAGDLIEWLDRRRLGDPVPGTERRLAVPAPRSP